MALNGTTGVGAGVGWELPPSSGAAGVLFVGEVELAIVLVGVAAGVGIGTVRRLFGVAKGVATAIGVGLGWLIVGAVDELGTTAAMEVD